jgi:hypothetical protein
MGDGIWEGKIPDALLAAVYTRDICINTVYQEDLFFRSRSSLRSLLQSSEG